MTITERTLRDWRKQALVENSELTGWDSAAECTSHRREMCERILRLTQELLDIHLIRKEIVTSGTKQSPSDKPGTE